MSVNLAIFEYDQSQGIATLEWTHHDCVSMKLHFDRDQVSRIVAVLRGRLGQEVGVMDMSDFVSIFLPWSFLEKHGVSPSDYTDLQYSDAEAILQLLEKITELKFKSHVVHYYTPCT